MRRTQIAVVVLVAILLAGWLFQHSGRLAGDPDGQIRLVLGSVFALLILTRRPIRQFMVDTVTDAPRRISVAAVTGALLSILGLIVGINQFQWLGLLLLAYAGLRWSLPGAYVRNALPALLVFYWVHPLPSQLLSAFQLGMRSASVAGAEWLLHGLNVRAWADVFALHTGFRTFPVPNACSGMRTVVTVLVCTVGLGLLLKLTWRAIIAFLALGTLQVLLLNILRITFMVIWASRMPLEWASTFLHDTLGLFLLVAIVVIQLEIAAWHSIKARQLQHGQAVPPSRGDGKSRTTILPKAWRRIVRWAPPVAIVVLLVLAIAFAAYKRRPAHRAAMIEGVLDALLETDPAMAEKAAITALAFTPDARSLKSKRIRSMVVRSKYEPALAALDELDELDLMETVMKSVALMGLKRPEESIALLNQLPPQTRTLPAVAMVRAQYAAQQNRPRVVAENVELASKSRTLAAQVRGLFPYLAAHSQWQSIVKADDPAVRYREVSHALAVIQACLRANDMGHAVSTLSSALETWPVDARFLGSLAAMAQRRPGSRWEALFEQTVHKNLLSLGPDPVVTAMEQSFTLVRPDLAWLLYRRLLALDPAHPYASVAPARYASAWFRFQKRRLGLASEDPLDTIDVAPFLGLGGAAWPLTIPCSTIPLFDELVSTDARAVRNRYLGTALDEFSRREAKGTLTPLLQMRYPAVLAMAGRYPDAHARLEALRTTQPQRTEAILLQHAIFYDQTGDWEKCYEALREYHREGLPTLDSHLMLIGTLMNLNLGTMAMDTARRALALFPDAPEAKAAASAAWYFYGFREQALFVMPRTSIAARSPTMAKLLYETGRLTQARSLAGAFGMKPLSDTIQQQFQLAILPAAEWFSFPRWPPPMTDKQMAGRAKLLHADSAKAVSPFVKQLLELEARWYAARGTSTAPSAADWRAAGRDDHERAAALHRLSLLLARQERHAEALVPAREAAALMPVCPVLRWTLIALTRGDAAIVSDARKACPADPHMWLADLVARTRSGSSTNAPCPPWVLDELQSAVASGAYSIGTLVRAGDFVLRMGWPEPAAVVARHTLDQSNDFLPAAVLGLRCALASRDPAWALACASKAATIALDPTPFHQVVVSLKAARKSADIDMMRALQQLRDRFPDNPQWTAMLGMVHFWKGDSGRALRVLSPIIDKTVGQVRLQTLVLAAESARLEGDPSKALKILEFAHTLYPDDLSVLNNLVYSLAADPRQARRALEFVPQLLKLGGDSAAVLDTVAMAFLHAGDIENASNYIHRALKRVKRADYAALELRTNAAEIMLRQGKLADAQKMLEALRRDPDFSGPAEIRTRRLLRIIEQQQTKD